ncbi:hypothetical protein [Azospirillum canadense]|uniref:hypothetical protein n=1 Tax=Azospirillum canadense TaxID=403962 RepID=UPI002226CB62|nr:hypothetical protein [Azospirillum canadense]MCW2243916.1 hypothetical protein [Azospirillum canadense]
MLNIAAIRRAIEDVELAASAGAADQFNGGRSDGGRWNAGPPLRGTLARLYGVYAQRVLELHGISVDLEELCTQCCRQCPDGRCVRDEAAGQ